MTKWETQVVERWILNDYALYTKWSYVIEDLKTVLEYNKDRDTLLDRLAERLEDDFTNELRESLSAGPVYDLAEGALEEVDWQEVAETLVGDN